MKTRSIKNKKAKMSAIIVTNLNNTAVNSTFSPPYESDRSNNNRDSLIPIPPGAPGVINPMRNETIYAGNTTKYLISAVLETSCIRKKNNVPYNIKEQEIITNIFK